MSVRGFSVVGVIAVALLAMGCGKKVDAKAEAQRVFFQDLKDGAKVTSPVKVCIGVENLVVEPAGKELKPGHGHHHILVDTPAPTELGTPIPKDGQHIHMGDGSSCHEVTLDAGHHTLALLFADSNHVPYAPAISASIKVEVVAAK